MMTSRQRIPNEDDEKVTQLIFSQNEFYISRAQFVNV